MDEELIVNFSEMAAEQVIQIMNLYHKSAAVVSSQLMVLGQTDGCEFLLEQGSFFSLEDCLPHSACEEIRVCIEQQETKQIHTDLSGRGISVHLLPMNGNALLVFETEEQRMPALLLDAARMRDSAAVLLGMVSQIEKLSGGELTAARVRREAMRLLRQASHSEMLGGAGARPQYTVCDLGEMLRDISAELLEKGFSVRVESKGDLLISADVSLLRSAVATLISNSIRFGGEDVNIVLRALRSGEGYLIRVEDDGPGMSVQATQRAIEGWKQPDAGMLDGDWGMGIPFAQQVAQLHGGRLYYLYGGSGCTACLVLHDCSDNEMDADMGYQDSGLNELEVELSVVLGAEVFRKTEKA